MGFLEGTGANSSPEGIASRGFARAWLGMALREMWVRMEGPVLCSCRAEWLPASAWAIFSCTEIKIQINCPESSGCPDVSGMELCHQGTAVLVLWGSQELGGCISPSFQWAAYLMSPEGLGQPGWSPGDARDCSV